jgi:hypothetical protein
LLPDDRTFFGDFFLVPSAFFSHTPADGYQQRHPAFADKFKQLLIDA